jgi:hypothetical protein
VASVDAPEALNDMLLSFLEKVDAASGQEER